MRRWLIALIVLFWAVPVGAATRTVNVAGGAQYTSIQACVNAAQPGDTCSVAAGDYSAENVITTARSGTSETNRITLVATGEAIVKAFYIKHQFITVNGFTVTKYSTGLNQAAIQISSAGSYAHILNNTIKDGIYLTSSAFVFDATGKTITNAAGGFTAAGFAAGQTIYISSDVTAPILNHDNDTSCTGDLDFWAGEVKTIATATDTVLTLDAGNTVCSEGPVQSTIYVNVSGFDKNGVWGLMMTPSGGVGPENCIIENNTFSDLAGRTIQIWGNHNVVQHNTFTGLNGWRIFTIDGNYNLIHGNLITDSTRWAGFTPPTEEVGAEGGGTWDMFDTLIASYQATAPMHNVIEQNIFKDVDDQFANVEGDGGSYFIIQNNVFVNVEVPGSGLHRPHTIVRHNTFYGPSVAGEHPLYLKQSEVHGDPNPSQIVSNAFVGLGSTPAETDQGWYDIESYVTGVLSPGVSADYNFVAGPSPTFASKTGFAIPGYEAHGVNGGDPKFADISDILGEDGLPFTLDDGLKPASDSPLCGAGENGEDIGAYSCDAGTVIAGATRDVVLWDQGGTSEEQYYAGIQGCVNRAMPGDTCTAYPGVYDERVTSVRGGTSNADADRIIIKASGTATMRGFYITHPYLTIDGFDITGPMTAFQFYIWVGVDADDTHILNNTVRDGAASVGGIGARISSGDAANDCWISGNRISNLAYTFSLFYGDSWLIENNTYDMLSNDYIRLFGTNHTIKRNIFMNSAYNPATGGHRDMIQTFGVSATTPSYGHIIEENWFENLLSQFSQMNSGSGTVDGLLWDNIRDITLRKNIIVNLSDNANMSVPGMVVEHNTFYQYAWQAGTGLTAGASLSRGEASRMTVRSNVFLAGGTAPDAANGTVGWYGLSFGTMNLEQINLHITLEDPEGDGQVNNSSISCTPGAATYCPNACAIKADLVANGYIDSNGTLSAAAKALTSFDDFVYGAGIATWAAATYAHLVETAVLGTAMWDDLVNDYNYAAGSAASSYAAKRSSDCVVGTKYTSQNFCEAVVGNGLNGGDPLMQDVTNPRGPDGIPFTLDDGLKPTAKSPLCTAGYSGTPIGAYSCDPNKVFYDGGSAPRPATNVIIKRPH